MFTFRVPKRGFGCYSWLYVACRLLSNIHGSVASPTYIYIYILFFRVRFVVAKWKRPPPQTTVVLATHIELSMCFNLADQFPRIFKPKDLNLTTIVPNFYFVLTGNIQKHRQKEKTKTTSNNLRTKP